MNLFSSLKTIANWTLDLIFPIACIYCGKDGLFLCSDCQGKLERLENQFCLVCKKHAPFGKTHPACASRNKLDGIVSALPYANPQTKKLISTFKYEFIFDLAKPLSQIIIEACNNQELGNYFSDFTIIPVPLHRKRRNWRGFNQAELLAQSLGSNLQIPLDTNLVQRSKFTKPQVNLSAEERQQNIADAFKIKNPVYGKYLLVDDVVTTGSTLNEIAKLLKKSGAQEVWAVTIAHG